MKRTALKRGTSQIKRSGFKKKATKPMKRGKLSKSGKSSISKLKKKLWIAFGAYIRKRDGGICFICGRKSEGSGYHAGHFIPKSVGGLALYFHEDNVHGCCYHCNINLGGNLYEYGVKLGEERVKTLYKLKGLITKMSTEDYEKKITEYQVKLLALEKQL